MSSNAFAPTDTSVDAYINAIEPPAQREDCRRLRHMIETAAGAPAVMWGSSIVGAGSYHYRYESGREGDSAAVSFAPRTGKIALYLAGGHEGREDLLTRVGKHTKAKSCIYLKTLDGLDMDALGELLTEAVDHAREIDAR